MSQMWVDFNLQQTPCLKNGLILRHQKVYPRPLMSRIEDDSKNTS